MGQSHCCLKSLLWYICLCENRFIMGLCDNIILVGLPVNWYLGCC